jgi:hypothetical protein
MPLFFFYTKEIGKSPLTPSTSIKSLQENMKPTANSPQSHALRVLPDDPANLLEMLHLSQQNDFGTKPPTISKQLKKVISIQSLKFVIHKPKNCTLLKILNAPNFVIN